MAQDAVLVTDEEIGSDEEDVQGRVAVVVRETLLRADIADLFPQGVDPTKPAKGVIWAEARVENSDNEPIPLEDVIAVSRVHVVPVEIDNETRDVTTNSSLTNEYGDSVELTELPSNIENGGIHEVDTLNPAPITCSIYRWNLFVFVLGNSFLLVALASTFGLEIAAGLLYIFGAGFFWVSDGLRRAGLWTFPFQAIFRLMSSLLLLLDLLLLTISALLVEIFAWLAGILCVLFGGIRVGAQIHKHIQDACQLMQNPFRSLPSDWNPQRIQPHAFRYEPTASNEI